MRCVFHEFTTAAYWPDTGDPRAGNRYAGHHARILEERGTLAAARPSKPPCT